MVAAVASSTVLVASCWQAGDSSTDDPALGSVQQAFLGQPLGGLEGHVRAAYAANGTRTVSLPGTTVWAQNIGNGTLSAQVTTDSNGSYYIPLAPAVYKICWSKSGFTSACTASTFSVGSVVIGVGLSDVALTGSTVVRGSVKLTDGSPCLNRSALFGIAQTARVEMVNGSGVVVSTAGVNTQGEFILPGGTAPRTMRATCGTSVQSFLVNSSLDTTGTTSDAIVVPNARPILKPITTFVSNVDVRQGVAAGAVVPLTVSATDPNGDALTYHWKVPSGSGTLPDSGTSSATWTLPSIAGTYSAYVSVDDGKGGFVTEAVQVIVRTSGTVLISGTVHDPLRHAIPGATISVAGVIPTVTSDARGNFSLSVPQSTAYVLNIEKEGYGELSKRLNAPATGREYILADTTKQAINPAVSNVIVDTRPGWMAYDTAYPRRGGSVNLPANSLDLTVPPVGQMYAYITTYDPTGQDLAGEMPGDMGGVNSAAASVFLVSQGALFIEIRDSIGTKYNLASGKTATVNIPISGRIVANDPALAATIDSWTFDPASGNWTQLAGGGTRVGNDYVTTVTHFSTKNADLQKTTPACLFVDFDPSVTATTLSSFINVEVAPNAPRRREFPLDKAQENLLYNLPPNTPYTLQIYTTDGVYLNAVTGTTGTLYKSGSGEPVGVERLLCTRVTLTASTLGVPGATGAFQRYLNYGYGKGPGVPQPAGAGYYKATLPSSTVMGIDQNDLRTDLKKFFVQNHFNTDGTPPAGTPAGLAARAYYINNGDLGFGRDMHCLQTGADVACYVSNYGGPDQSPGNFTKAQAADKPSVQATVAMEYSTIEGDSSGVRVVKFYVFAGACTDAIAGCGAVNSPRVDSANLDGAGVKYVPNLCTTCHGGDYTPQVNANPTLNDLKTGSNFLAFDVASFRDGTAGPKASDPAGHTGDVLTQDASFFSLNQMVLATNPPQPIQDFISLSYHSNGTTPFVPNVVPCGWRQSTAGTVCNNNFSTGTADINTEKLYLDVVAPACRSCHMSFSAEKQFDTYKKFQNLSGLVGTGADNTGYGIGGLVCTTGQMPNSSVTSTNFWRSNGPHGPDTLRLFSKATAPNVDSPAWPTAFGTCAPP
jgi:hypothetical protein